MCSTAGLVGEAKRRLSHLAGNWTPLQSVSSHPIKFSALRRNLQEYLPGYKDEGQPTCVSPLRDEQAERGRGTAAASVRQQSACICLPRGMKSFPMVPTVGAGQLPLDVAFRDGQMLQMLRDNMLCTPWAKCIRHLHQVGGHVYARNEPDVNCVKSVFRNSAHISTRLSQCCGKVSGVIPILVPNLFNCIVNLICLFACYSFLKMLASIYCDIQKHSYPGRRTATPACLTISISVKSVAAHPEDRPRFAIQIFSSRKPQN